MKLLTTILVLVTFVGTCIGQSDSIKTKQQIKAELMAGKPRIPIKTIGIYIYDGFNMLDAIGPYQTLTHIPGAKVFFVSKKKGLVSNPSGIKIEATRGIDELNQVDILVIPGGARETFLQTQDTAVINWIRRIDEHTVYTTSVCTGAWILGATGLLKGKSATTNWYRAEEMMRKYGAQFKEERWVQDGKYWTSAGVSAGIDMSLAIMNDLLGPQHTQAAMLDMEYSPKPPIKGGTPKTSDPIVAELMKEMYDYFLLSLISK